MNKNPDVDSYFANLVHPLKEEIQRVREIILSANDQIEEAIKWKSPTFMYKGNIASFFMNAKKHVSLMFHKGAMIPDQSGLLQGEAKEGRTAKFKDMDEVEARKEHLQNIIRKWIDLMDAE